MSKLAILGGAPVREKLFDAYNPIGSEEIDAVYEVMKTGNLSQFLGVWHDDFYGGPKIKEFEKKWSELYKVKHTVSVNSATSGLYAAVGACGIKPGDEVIVSPYSMSASAVAPMVYGAVPVFADLEKDTFGFDPIDLENKITEKTKAIIVVHIFGSPSNMNAIIKIAKKYNLYVIEDCAQAPLCNYKGKYVGTIGDIGIFSLNYHKHIHTGEGGMITTNNEKLAEKLQLIRNHGEAVVEKKGTEDLFNTLGFNYRLTEVQAAIGITQLNKIENLLKLRRENANYLNQELEKLEAIQIQKIDEDITHAYYNQVFLYKDDILEVHRNTFVKAVSAELPSAYLREKVPLIGYGYVKPIYLLPLFQKRVSMCSFNCPRYEGNIEYLKGLCPVTEKLHYTELFNHEFIRSSMKSEDLKVVVEAYNKVYNNVDELRKYEKKNPNCC